jgi:hypothetical protein
MVFHPNKRERTFGPRADIMPVIAFSVWFYRYKLPIFNHGYVGAIYSAHSTKRMNFFSFSHCHSSFFDYVPC